MRMAAFLDSDSSDGEDFEGFVVSPEEKESYKVWTKKRRASVAFDNSSDSDDNLTGDEDDDDDDDDDDEEEEEDDDDDDDYDSAEEEDEGNEVDDVLGDISLQDSGDEKLSSHMDQCPVCLMSLKEQLLGTPNNCPHVFCFECIQEWAKNATTCPVGRQPFTEILVHATRKGPVLKRIPVEERKADDDEVEEDPTYCEVCGGYDREDRMLLCDGCDQGYHMDCLTPAVAYVPIDEWYCPACASRIQPHVDPEELLHEGHAEEGLGGVPRVRATRGRPRGSTARRVSALGRTGTTQRARTVASTRGRGRTQRGRGRGRGRGKSSTRGRGRGRPRSSTRGQKRSKTKGQKRRRRKTSRPSEKTTGSSRIKRGRKLSKTRNPIKRRRIAEEDEVSPFIYEPVRRGRTVHARLLESLNSSGPTVEPGRSASLGRMPFPSRVEASSSFSLFGNTYALHDFADEEEETGEVSKGQDKTTAWSSESANPDVLGSIFQGLDSLLSSSDKVARDGKIITSTGHTLCRSSSSSNAKAGKDSLGSCEDEIKLSFDVNISEKSAEEGKCRLKETDKSSKEPDTAKHSSKDERRQNDHVCFRENIFEKVSLSRTADMRAGSCGMLSDTSRPQKTSSPLPLIERRYSSPSTPVSSKCALSSFRIPKRSSKSQDEPSSPLVKQDPSLNSCISKFKIPKRTNSISSDDSSKEECSNSSIRKSVGQTSPVSLTFRIGQNMSHFPSTSNSVTHSNCVTESKSAKSCLTYTNSFRPIMQKNFQRKNSFNSSTTGTEPSVSDSCNVIRSHATTVKTMSRSMTLSGAAISATCGPPVVVGSGSAVAGPSVTNSNSVTTCQAKNHSRTSTASTTARGVTNSDTGKACHSAKASDILRTRSKTSSSLTKVTPLIDHLKAVEGKEQRRSNIEIIKMLQEKQKSMRKQMSCDLKGSSNARPRHSGKVDTNVLPKKEIHVSDKSSTCSRGVTLPVAIVKPSPQVQSPALNALSVVPGSSMQNSPVKSIASGIIDAHSSNNWEFKRVCSASGSYSGHVATTRKRGGTASRANGDREQQRKLGIARLQRHEQIIDEVKLALKPFFKHGEIDKDDYKLIMRKSVEKIKESSSSVDRDRVSRLVKKYIKKIKGVNFSGSP